MGEGGAMGASLHPTPTPLWELERWAIIQALQWSHGNVQQAATALEIGITTLYRKMAGYEIPRAPAKSNHLAKSKSAGEP